MFGYLYLVRMCCPRFAEGGNKRLGFVLTSVSLILWHLIFGLTKETTNFLLVCYLNAVAPRAHPGCKASLDTSEHWYPPV